MYRHAVRIGEDDAVAAAPALFDAAASARAIPGATTHEIDAGHAACTLQTESFVPALVEAVNTVHARRRDFAQLR